MAATRRLTVRFLAALFRRYPPRETIFKEPGPRGREEYADEVRFGFHRYFGAGLELYRDREVLDLGSGYGGRPLRFLELGARRVIGVEIADEMVELSRAFAREHRAEERLEFLRGTGEAIPLPDSSFDLVTMNDVMEHVIDPREVLAECRRVLRPGGTLAVVFPPYYDFSAGSHLHGYATRVPGLNLLFSTESLKTAAGLVMDERGANYRPFLREVPTDKLWNQNGVTVRGFTQAVSESGFRVDTIRYLGHLDHRISNHRGVAAAVRRPLFLLAELPAQVPGLQEVACVRVCALLRR